MTDDINDTIRGYAPNGGDDFAPLLLEDLGKALEEKEEENGKLPPKISDILMHLRQLTTEYRCAPVAKHLNKLAENIAADQEKTRKALKSLAAEFIVRATYQPGQRYTVSALVDLGIVFVIGGKKIPLTLEPGDIITIHKNSPRGLEFSTEKIPSERIAITSSKAASIQADPVEPQ
ncbi:MAG TPA: hypothetical protein VHA78_03760 [Candidatus Peribacteraceae bacterium]|nr:hypothetical protein [Candidatus Peribacteraceae bacterium]